MFRDFLYLDTERVQSIIAQLEKGVLEKVLEGKGNELEGKAGLAAGVLASFLPINLSGSISSKHEIQTSKVLHDYAFTIALEALDRERLLLEIENLERKDLLLPDAAFILVRGSLSILDYGLLKGIADNERTIEKLLSSPKSKQAQSRSSQNPNKTQTGVIKQIWTLADIFMGDTVQVHFRYINNILFAGPISRDFLRESIRDVILKYGGMPREGWTMLAQIAQVTNPTDKKDALTDFSESLSSFNSKNIQSLADFFNPTIEILNMFQELMASISFPAISITPIAIYRELERIN